MWSIGIISTMLLTRDVIFRANNLPIPGQDPKKVMAKLTANCDLRILDSPGSAWRSVGKRPKDFVRHLLVVDEAKRLDVKQALAHPWFTNKYCREGFDTVYKKAIAGWQPRHKAYRVVEALDLSKLKPILNKQRTDDQARSRFFMDFSCPFPQGDLYSGSIRSSGKAVPELLPTIGEEATPEPETPLRDPLDAPLAPRSKKPPQAISVHDVDYSLGHIDVDSNVPASKAITDTNMTDRDQEMEYDSFDLDAPVRRSPVPQMRVPPQMTTQTKEIVQETPPKHLKRPYEPEPDLEDTYNSSIEIMGEYVSTGAKFAKKFRVLR